VHILLLILLMCIVLVLIVASLDQWSIHLVYHILRLHLEIRLMHVIALLLIYFWDIMVSVVMTNLYFKIIHH
jgi:hypothetical protein